MGIALPFFLKNAQSQPSRVGKWFGITGDLLANGKINEAIAEANNESIWFTSQ